MDDDVQEGRPPLLKVQPLKSLRDYAHMIMKVVFFFCEVVKMLAYDSGLAVFMRTRINWRKTLPRHIHELCFLHLQVIVAAE